MTDSRIGSYQGPSLTDYVNKIVEQESKGGQGSLALDDKGKLYVSTKSGSTPAEISGLSTSSKASKFSFTFNKAGQQKTAERQNRAAREFIKLLSEAAGGTPKDLVPEVLNNSASYKFVLDKMAEISPVFVKNVNMATAGQLRMDPDNFNSAESAKALKFLKGKEVNVGKLNPEDKQAFAKVYNDLLCAHVAQLGGIADEKTIGNLMSGEIKALKQLANNPGLGKRLAAVVEQSSECVSNMVVQGFQKNNSEGLAKETVKLCCLLNGFGAENKGKTGFANDEEAKELVMRVLIGNIVNKDVPGVENQGLKEFAVLSGKNQKSVVGFASKKALDNMADLENYNFLYQISGFTDYAKKVGFKSPQELVSLDTLKMLGDMCNNVNYLSSIKESKETEAGDTAVLDPQKILMDAVAEYLSIYNTQLAN